MVQTRKRKSKVVDADAALLRARGLALCKPDPGTKSPTYPVWGTYSLEPGDFSPGDLHGIIGGPLSDCNRPGHALVIVDIDDMQALEKADEFLPSTAMEEGRPGKLRDHRYFLTPFSSIPKWAESHADQAAPAAKKTKGHPGPFKRGFNHKETKARVIDFLGTGGQAVCPGGSSPRQWEGGAPGEPAIVSFVGLWEAVCKLAQACGCKMPSVNGMADQTKEFPVPTGTDVIKRCIAYLDKIDPAVSGQDGHAGTYWPARVACLGFDLGEEQGFRVLWDHFNHRCSPPWSEKDLRHKCRDADTLPFDKPRGWLLHENYNSRGSNPNGTPASADNQRSEHTTDLGNARRLVRWHGTDLRHCHPWKEWLVWDGRRWRVDDTAEVMRRAKATVRRMFDDATAEIKRLRDQDEDTARVKEGLALASKMLAWSFGSEAATRLTAMVSLTRSEPGVPILPDALDTDLWLLNVANGTLDLRTGQLRPHRREDLLTKLSPVTYDPDAKCPLWDQFLYRIMERRQHLIDYLRRVVGYGLTGEVSEQCIWFFHGVGANGKSTFLAAILAMLGDYGMQAVPELLMMKTHEAHPTERADLFGKRLVATIETDEGKRLAEALLKQLTGGDRIRARWMNKDFFEFPPTHKIVLAANHYPVVRGCDHGMWRRIKLVPFTVTIPDAEKDKDLLTKLKCELPGILAWAVRGCEEWRTDGLNEPEEVRQATANYRAEQDTVQAFLAACCILHPDARIRVSALHEAYLEWSGDRLMSARFFADRLREAGYHSERGTGGAYYWHGIGLPAREVDEWAQ